jgi:hypothetical protein
MLMSLPCAALALVLAADAGDYVMSEEQRAGDSKEAFFRYSTCQSNKLTYAEQMLRRRRVCGQGRGGEEIHSIMLKQHEWEACCHNVLHRGMMSLNVSLRLFSQLVIGLLERET